MNRLKEIWANRWVRFGVVTFLYLLWFVVWTGNLWLLLGVVVIYDIYISKWMYRLFWKKHKERKRSNKTYRKTSEWIEAIVFATVVATLIRIFFFEMYVIPTPSMEKSMLVGDYLCVSKVAYGPKMPNTPLSFPFVHNTMPLSQTQKSFVEWIKWPYHRLAGFGEVKRNDPVVFNFPEGDTVSLSYPADSYYNALRQYQRVYGEQRGRQMLLDEGIVVRPVDKRENYVKRAVALPGDTILIRHSEVWINGEPQVEIPGKQYNYTVYTNGTAINPDHFEDMGIAQADIHFDANQGVYFMMPLTAANAERIRAMGNVTAVEKSEAEGADPDIFPHDTAYAWNVDNFGPLWIPSKGATVELTVENLPLYRRIIETYEGHRLEVKGDRIYIDGKEANRYTFAMDYYFMMGDNRHNSADSRYWGFVPEDHIVGKPSFVWLSLDKEKSFPANIRWNRLFSKIR